jgi:prepilin peptidase CpaA
MFDLDPPALLLVVTWLLASLGAASDLRTATIPNLLTLPLLGLAPLVHALHGGPGALLASLVGLVSCGLVPFLLFCRNAMGGGDVKLLAALGSVFGANLGLQVQLLSLSCAAVYACVVLAFRGELFAMLLRSATLLVPERLRRVPDAHATKVMAATTSLRLGPAIALATTLAVAPTLASWLL